MEICPDLPTLLPRLEPQASSPPNLCIPVSTLQPVQRGIPTGSPTLRAAVPPSLGIPAQQHSPLAGTITQSQAAQLPGPPRASALAGPCKVTAGFYDVPQLGAGLRSPQIHCTNARVCWKPPRLWPSSKVLDANTKWTQAYARCRSYVGDQDRVSLTLPDPSHQATSPSLNKARVCKSQGCSMPAWHSSGWRARGLKADPRARNSSQAEASPETAPQAEGKGRKR